MITIPCKGCSNQQCNCFVASSPTVATVGNGSQYSPYTFRPKATPFPRPFGHLQGATSQPLDGTPYSLFPASTVEDIDGGGNMIVGNGTQLIAPADGLYILSFTVKVGTTAAAGLNDNVSLRKNGTTLLSTATFAHQTTLTSGTHLYLSSMTLVDLNQNDTIDLFVDRVVGVGSVDINYLFDGTHHFIQVWGFWVSGPI